MNTSGPLRRVGAVLTTMLVLLVACAPPPPAAAPPRPEAPAANPAEKAAAQAPAPRGTAKSGGILRIGAEIDVQELDPHTTRVGWDIAIMQHVYSGLVRAGEDSLPRPDLATRWELTDPT